METVASSTTITGSSIPIGLHWLSTFTVNSGTAPTSIIVSRFADRGEDGVNPFNSAMVKVEMVFGADAGDISVWVYPTDPTTTSIPVLDWMTATGWLYSVDYPDFADVTSAIAQTEIFNTSTLVADAESESFDLTAFDTEFDTKFLPAALKKTPAEFRANTWRWQVKMRVIKPAVVTPTVGFVFAEPQLAFSHTPDPSPFTPQVARWEPRRTWNVITPANITADQNNYSPSNLATADVVRISSTPAVTITGMAAQSRDRIVQLVNTGTNTITLAHNSGLSDAANIFWCPGAANYDITSYASVRIFYDDTSNHWRVLGA